MNSPDTQSPEALEVADRRKYETRDANWRVIAWLALAVALLAGVSQVGLWFLLKGYRSQATQRDPQLSPLVNVEQIPPQPRLQSAPMLDYADFIARQDEQLDSYGWVDKQQKIVRIPISRAMDLALERGLPKPAASEATKVEQK
jgi:hypothetical protein